MDCELKKNGNPTKFVDQSLFHNNYKSLFQNNLSKELELMLKLISIHWNFIVFIRLERKLNRQLGWKMSVWKMNLKNSRFGLANKS